MAKSLTYRLAINLTDVGPVTCGFSPSLSNRHMLQKQIQLGWTFHYHDTQTKTNGTIFIPSLLSEGTQIEQILKRENPNWEIRYATHPLETPLKHQ